MHAATSEKASVSTLAVQKMIHSHKVLRKQF